MVSNGVPIHVLSVSHEGLDKVFPYQTTTKSVLTADDFEPIVQFQVKPEEIVEYDGNIYLNYFEEKCKKADVSTVASRN